MAKANTFGWDKIDGYVSKKNCAICGQPSKWRVFFYPTFMNGDAEWCGDYCAEHKLSEQDIIKVCKGEIKILYKIDD